MNRLAIMCMTLSLLLGGCSCRERYEPAISQWQENLEESVRPALVDALNASAMPMDLQETKLDVLDRTIQGMKRTRGQGPEVWSGE